MQTSFEKIRLLIKFEICHIALIQRKHVQMTDAYEFVLSHTKALEHIRYQIKKDVAT